MKAAILGGGFTGLTAALRLLQEGFEVTVIEKEPAAGGLAGGFRDPRWQWSLEKAYHHWFTNDEYALRLAQELGYPVIITRPRTDIYVRGNILPLDSPLSLIKFPHLPLFNKMRMGLILLYLRLGSSYKRFENIEALPWLRKYMGPEVTRLIWEPLFRGKFGTHKEEVSLTWFWARIKKRTPSLAYPQGGFQEFADKIAEKVRNLGGEILLNTEVAQITPRKDRLSVTIKPQGLNREFDIVISTLPTPVFTKAVPQLPTNYPQKASKITHLSALNLILVLKKPFLKNTYWLNITDTGFPFLVLAEHTNFMHPKHYANQHILYIGNYLPPDHPYLKMTAQQLLKIYDPFLKKINSTYHQSQVAYHLFQAPFAQPVVTTNYAKDIPGFHTPIPRLYQANMEMVYPWDRGTNYAIEMGEKVAELVDTEN